MFGLEIKRLAFSFLPRQSVNFIWESRSLFGQNIRKSKNLAAMLHNSVATLICTRGELAIHPEQYHVYFRISQVFCLPTVPNCERTFINPSSKTVPTTLQLYHSTSSVLFAHLYIR